MAPFFQGVEPPLQEGLQRLSGRVRGTLFAKVSSASYSCWEIRSFRGLIGKGIPKDFLPE